MFLIIKLCSPREFSAFALGKAGHVGSTKRAGLLLRPTSPKSPVASAFESVEESDEEDNMTENTKLDTSYLHTNGNVVM